MAKTGDEAEPILKKAKMDIANSALYPFKDFSNIKFSKVLNNFTDTKRIVLQCEMTVENETKQVIVGIEKTPFDKEAIASIISKDVTLHQLFHNDVYSSYMSTSIPEKFTEVKVDAVFPADEKQITRHSYQQRFMVEETPDIYNAITLKYIADHALDHQWVYNVLDGKSEADRVIFNDPDPENGFMLLPDLKWISKNGSVDNLYVVGLCHKRGIKSIRDLRPEHLRLLENMLSQGRQVIEDKFGLPKSQIRAYLHYKPSFFHLHVHYNNINFNASGCQVQTARLLTDVIANIKMVPDYYARTTMGIAVLENHALCEMFRDAGVF